MLSCTYVTVNKFGESFYIELHHLTQPEMCEEIYGRIIIISKYYICHNWETATILGVLGMTSISFLQDSGLLKTWLNLWKRLYLCISPFLHLPGRGGIHIVFNKTHFKELILQWPASNHFDFRLFKLYLSNFF